MKIMKIKVYLHVYLHFYLHFFPQIMKCPPNSFPFSPQPETSRSRLAWSPVGVLADGEVFPTMTSEVHHAAACVQDLKLSEFCGTGQLG